MTTNSKEYNNKNYDKYWGTKEEIKKRSNRNKARKMKGLKVGDKREVDHKNGNALDNSKNNLRIISSKTNKQRGAAKANKRRWG